MKSRDMEKYSNKLLEILWDLDEADAILWLAARGVDEAAGGDYSRDNIRTQPFTELVKQYCTPLGQRFRDL
jgi:hypothetical protein